MKTVKSKLCCLPIISLFPFCICRSRLTMDYEDALVIGMADRGIRTWEIRQVSLEGKNNKPFDLLKMRTLLWKNTREGYYKLAGVLLWVKPFWHQFSHITGRFDSSSEYLQLMNRFAIGAELHIQVHFFMVWMSLFKSVIDMYWHLLRNLNKYKLALAPTPSWFIWKYFMIGTGFFLVVPRQ